MVEHMCALGSVCFMDNLVSVGSNPWRRDTQSSKRRQLGMREGSVELGDAGGLPPFRDTLEDTLPVGILSPSSPVGSLGAHRESPLPQEEGDSS